MAALQLSDSCLLPCRTSSEANAAALKAGTDLNCESYGDLRLSYVEGLVSKADIQKAAGRIVEHKIRLGVLDPPASVPFSSIPATVIGAPYHLLRAVRAAQKGNKIDCLHIMHRPACSGNQQHIHMT